jgi:CarD family transcriptional regulator
MKTSAGAGAGGRSFPRKPPAAKGGSAAKTKPAGKGVARAKPAVAPGSARRTETAKKVAKAAPPRAASTKSAARSRAAPPKVVKTAVKSAAGKPSAKPAPSKSAPAKPSAAKAAPKPAAEVRESRPAPESMEITPPKPSPTRAEPTQTAVAMAAAEAPTSAPSAVKPTPSPASEVPSSTALAQAEAERPVRAQAAPAPPASEAEADEEPPPSRPQPGMPQLPHLHRPPPRPAAPPEIFAEGDHVVYPTHGVGKVERIAIEEIAGQKLELIHITFEENRMTLRVPVAKARSAGLRKLATRELFDKALDVLRGRARVKRTMWSRRAQEYEAKINSGDPLAIAEVVRDLHRNAGQPDQSFSERQIYEQAMDRLAAELAALDQTDKTTAAIKLTEFLKTL